MADGRVQSGDDSLQWEPFITLDVQEGRECAGEYCTGVGKGEIPLVPIPRAGARMQSASPRGDVTKIRLR
jgi:hypothetical protein